MRTIASIVSLLIAPLGFAQAIDQQQLANSAAISARALGGYFLYQSFTAGVTGNLVRVDLGFSSHAQGSAQVVIRAGDGIGGSSLGLSPAVAMTSIPGPPPNKMVTFNLTAPVAVTAGTRYTIQLVPVSMTDPYGVSLSSPIAYAMGTFYNQPGTPTAHTPANSMVFRTWVQ